MFINKILLKFAKLTSRKIVIAVLIQTMITLLVSITALLTGEMVRKVISSSRGIGIYVIVIIVLSPSIIIITSSDRKLNTISYRAIRSISKNNLVLSIISKPDEICKILSSII